jgi:Zn-dependent M28 family amino/carboxypeptidase
LNPKQGETKKMKRNRTSLVIVLVVALLATVIAGPSAWADTPTDTSALRDAVTVGGVEEHMAALEAIAIAYKDDGYRASGSPGYNVSADYVAERLADAGYQVTVQEFDFPFFEELSDPILEQLSPNPTVYPPYDDAGFATMEYSGSGDVTALVQAVDVIIPPAAAANTSTSGCEASDFADFIAGRIALVQRGTCTFALKAQNAEAAGAVGVIIFNEGQPGRTDAFIGTLGGPVVTIPAVGAAYAVGEELYNLSQAGEVTVRMMVDAVSETRTTSNVIGDTPGGRDDRVVLVGAHLDSVAEAPGTNDNGSGVATLLEIAEEMSELGIQPRNQVRFAFWGAEESGLVGSEYYVSQLSKRGIKDIALNLNFDMLASENYALFVYDGDGSDTPDAGPNGSANIEDIFVDYFASQDLPTYPTALDGRSDYDSFAAVGIPVGGLFTGADGVKTEEQAAIYGGTAGEQYDRNYHTPNDTLANADLEALDLMSDGVAHTVLTFAMTTSAVPGTSKGSTQAMKTPEFKGPRAQW